MGLSLWENNPFSTNNLFFFFYLSSCAALNCLLLCVHKPLQLQLNDQYVIPKVSSWSDIKFHSKCQIQDKWSSGMIRTKIRLLSRQFWVIWPMHDFGTHVATWHYTTELIQLLYIQIDAGLGFGKIFYMKSWCRCNSILVRIIVTFCIQQLILFCFTLICHHTFFLLSHLHILFSQVDIAIPGLGTGMYMWLHKTSLTFWALCWSEIMIFLSSVIRSPFMCLCNVI